MPASSLTIKTPVESEKKGAPLVFPEVVRKPKKNMIVPKKPNKRRKKKKKTDDDNMTREEMLEYFTGLQNDPNFNLLPFPRFVQETNPELFAGESKPAFEEKMKRLDFLDALENAKTEEEREALKAKRLEELKNQHVPHYQKLPVAPAQGLKG